MKTLIQRFQQLHNDETGQGLVEYVMLIALVIAAAAACFPGLSTALTNAFKAIGDQADPVRKLTSGVGRPRQLSCPTLLFAPARKSRRKHNPNS